MQAARIAVVIDEVQELAGDAAIVEMIRRIAAQGRAARVSIIMATQHPTNDAFGDATVKRNVTGRIALRVSDAKAVRGCDRAKHAARRLAVRGR